jgi:GT2 family glycosyltransferase
VSLIGRLPLIDPAVSRIPAISVIVPNWNGSPFLFDLLTSLGRWESREILVVDNGSSDGSAEMLRDFYPEVQCLSLSINEGFARAVNRGLHASRGDFIAIVNNDTAWKRDWLEPAAAFLRDNAAYSFAAPLVLNYFQRDRIDSAGDGVTRSLRPYKRQFDRPLPDGPLSGRDLVATSCSAVLFRRGFFEQVGSFDEDFFMYYEDADLFFRGFLRGHRGRLLPELRVYHREGASIRRLDAKNEASGSNRPALPVLLQAKRGKDVLLVRNRVWFLVKNCPRVYLLVAGPLLVWEFVRSLAWHVYHGTGGVFWRGHRQSLTLLRRMRIKRRIVQRTRCIPLRALWRELG